MMQPPTAAARSPYNGRSRLFAAARAAYDSKARFLACPWARGAGKTTTFQEVHARTATTFPRSTTLYLTDTIRRSIDVAWEDFVELAKRAAGKANHGLHVIRWPGASFTLVTGADNAKTFDRKRGPKRIALVHLDECQGWKSEILEYAVTKVFMPRMSDLEAEFGFKSRIVMTGTGGVDSKRSFWRRVCNGELGFTVIDGVTQWDNPHIADPEGEFITACNAAGVEWRRLDKPIKSRWGGRDRWVDTDDPMTRREWFAEFNSGGSLQIFPVHKAALIKRESLRGRPWTGMVSMWDYGTIDKCAGALWLFHRNEQKPKIVESVGKSGLSNAEMVKFQRDTTRQWAEIYKPEQMPFVGGDGGALGKGLVMDIAKTEGQWEVAPAEKREKVANIRTMAGDMRTGAFEICDDMTEFLDLLKGPQWHPDHIGERIAGHMPDEIDAAFYGYRKVKEHHYFEPAHAGLPEELAREAAIEKRIREMQRQANSTPYEQ